MEIAHTVSKRSTCDRKHVGSVIARNGQILATGYNGSLSGEAHCDDVGHDLVKLADGKENCLRTIHSEVNCIAQAAKNGVSINGAILYCNTYPCWACYKLIASSGIILIIYDAEYRKDERVDDVSKRGGPELVSLAELLKK